MNNLENSLSFAKKRLNINALYNDESLFNNFEFKSSFHSKINKKEINDNIYNIPFKDNDMNQFQGIIDTNINLNLSESDTKINFGEDPYSINKKLMRKINNKCFDNDLKHGILKYWWSISKMFLFEYLPNIGSYNDKDNKSLNLDYVKNIPYLYYEDISLNKYRLLLKKTILPMKFNNPVSVVIKDNKLLKKRKRKNKIIIMNNINIEQKISKKVRCKNKNKNN